MTGSATDARVVADEALAERHAVGLKTDEGRAVPAIAHDGVKGAMASTAEVGNLLGVQVFQRGWKRLEVVACCIGHVLL